MGTARLIQPRPNTRRMPVEIIGTTTTKTPDGIVRGLRRGPLERYTLASRVMNGDY